MIRSKADYKEYYQQDIKMTGLPPRTFLGFLSEKRYRFYRGLRRAEYYTNCRHDFFGNFFGKISRLSHRRLCEKTGWTIPINVFGLGLAIVHSGTIVVSGHARVGINCRIHVCVNIGCAPSRGNDGAPVIGNNCYIGPGAVLFGPIVLGDNIAVGANAVVNTSFPEGCCTIAGIPARKISDKTSAPYIKVS